MKNINKSDNSRRRYIFLAGFTLIIDGIIAILSMGHFWGGFAGNYAIREIKRTKAE